MQSSDILSGLVILVCFGDSICRSQLLVKLARNRPAPKLLQIDHDPGQPLSPLALQREHCLWRLDEYFGRAVLDVLIK